MNDAAVPFTIILTQGDPGGIGPEIVAKAVREWARPEDCRLIVVGYPAHFLTHWPSGAPLPDFTALEPLLLEGGEPGVYWANPGPEALNETPEIGRPTTRGGQSAARCIEAAIPHLMKERADALCTAPISKEGLRAAGYPFPGHTEFLAQRAGSANVAMMLVGGGLRVVLATIHEALGNVPGLLTKGKLIELFHLVSTAMPEFGVGRARLGVCGLNPHGGEGGIFGKEEQTIIGPAIQAAHAEGIDVSGPFAADTIFHRMLEGEFDVIVAMYHDQGLIPVKTLDFHRGVNITLGLPFIRTSPDHGTAYNIAGRGHAQTGSMLSALDHAYQLARRRRELLEEQEAMNEK